MLLRVFVEERRFVSHPVFLLLQHVRGPDRVRASPGDTAVAVDNDVVDGTENDEGKRIWRKKQTRYEIAGVKNSGNVGRKIARVREEHHPRRWILYPLLFLGLRGLHLLGLGCFERGGLLIEGGGLAMWRCG